MRRIQGAAYRCGHRHGQGREAVRFPTRTGKCQGKTPRRLSSSENHRAPANQTAVICRRPPSRPSLHPPTRSRLFRRIVHQGSKAASALSSHPTRNNVRVFSKRCSTPTLTSECGRKIPHVYLRQINTKACSIQQKTTLSTMGPWRHAGRRRHGPKPGPCTACVWRLGPRRPASPRRRLRIGTRPRQARGELL